MNCREAQPQIFAERDGMLDPVARAALDGHLAECEDCRKVRADLAATVSMWRAEAAAVAIPDAEREWHAVRRRIRAESGATEKRPRLLRFLWLALPLGAAAALAFFVFPLSLPSNQSVPSATPQVARADSVEAPGNNASTTVFVDEKSGWLIVWASDAIPKRG